MNRLLHLLSVALLLVSVVAPAMDAPFAECAFYLAEAGHPRIEILVHGEEESGDSTTRAAFLIEAMGGSIHLITEGAGNTNGPIYSVQNLKALAIQRLLVLRVEFMGVTPDTFQKWARTAWLNFILQIRKQPETWTEVIADKANHSGATILVKRLIGLDDEDDISEVIAQGNVYPDRKEWSELVCALALREIDKLEQERPSMRPWLKTTRKFFSPRVTLGDMIEASNQLAAIRERFIAENLAKVIQHNIDKDPIPYVILIAASQVSELTNVLKENFGEIPNIEIRSVEVPFDDVVRALSLSRVGIRPK